MTAREIQDRNYKRMAIALVAGAALVVFIYGAYIAEKHAFRNAVAALLVAAAPFALGGLAGFLFGIPKTLQAEPSGNDGTKSVSGRRHGWQANTNLEQVSDWLTKILIGVGLTQLQEIPGRIQDTADYIAESLGRDASPAIVASILITFSIAGFVIAYLLTKFDLGTAIDEQDGLLGELAKAIVKNPNDRAAVESFMLSSLYAESPTGFDNAIQTGESFLAQEGHPQDEDANVFGYLACAYGQKHAYLRENKATADEIGSIRLKVLQSAGQAIRRDETWRARLRQYANPPVGSIEDDLASLREDPELRSLLQMTDTRG